MTEVSDISLSQGRFARFEAIKWWDQSLLGRSRVLVIGAGALGNEVIKDLALLGVGHVIVADMDHVETSNLSRSVLFRPGDEGKPKAAAAARAAGEIYPDIHCTPIECNVLAGLGLGYFRWAQIVVGALDNREARVFVNSACARTGRPWIDGGIDVLSGIVRGFSPPKTACYECTMGQADWDLLAKRRSCSLLARQAMSQGGTPTTPTTASVIGAMQSQEVVKYLHGLNGLLGGGFVFEGYAHNSYKVEYPVLADCPWHEAPADIVAVDAFGSDTPLREISAWAASQLGGLDALDFSREIVQALMCPKCGRQQELFKPLEAVTASDALCERCHGECAPSFVHSLSLGSELLERSVAQVGLPRWDILWARRGDKSIGIELAGDCPKELRQPA